jgi:transglutaminase-like putative cysteine protease
MKLSAYKNIPAIVVIAAALMTLPSFSSAADKAPAWEDKYQDEPYVTLLTEQTVELRKDFTTVTTVHVVTKIQKESAKELGEISLDYDNSREVIKDIQAFTITPEGEKLKYQQIQDLTRDKDHAVYSDSRTKMITMPNVVVGSTIDWQATVETTKPVIEKNYYDTATFSYLVPVKVQRYTLKAPKDIPLHFSYLNTSRKPAVSHTEDSTSYTWEVIDNPKIEAEEHMPSWDEVAEVVSISTLNSWEEISRWSWKLFEKNLNLTDAMKKKVIELTKDRKTLPDKVQAIIEYIQEDLRYVAMNMDFHSYEPHPSDQVFSNKYGDCKDYTLLGMAMLSELGVKAYPVLYPSSRAFSRDRLLPMPTYFNHAILYFEVDGTSYYSDLLRKGYSLLEIPDAMSGKKVFVINEKGGFFGTIPPTDDAETVRVTDEHVVVRENGDTTIEITAFFPRNFSVELREEYQNQNDTSREKMFEYIESLLAAGGKVTEREWKNLDTPYTRISVRLKYDKPQWAQRVGNMLMFGMPQSPRGTAFTVMKRKYPIVFTSTVRKEKKVTYVLPEGYEVVNLPKDVILQRAFAGYERTYSVTGNSISGKEVAEYKESVTPAEQYQQIRDFHDDVTRLTNDMIMIRKKG